MTDFRSILSAKLTFWLAQYYRFAGVKLALMTLDSTIPDTPLEFDDLYDLVGEIDSAATAAELHGMLTGDICASSTTDVDVVLRACLAFLDGKNKPSSIMLKELGIVIAQTRKSLDDSELAFDMLLPDDDVFIDERTKGLADWCQGFMYGFAVAEKRHGLTLSDGEDVAEVLQDFAAISQAEVEEQADDKENEDDYMQLSEYVRVATMNIYAQCSAGDAEQNATGPLTVH